MLTIGRYVVSPGLCVVLLAGVTFAAAQATFTLNRDFPLSPLSKSPGEFDAFQDVQGEADPQERLVLASEFLEDYPESEFYHLILRLRFQALYELGDWEATVPAIEEGLVAEDAFREGKLGLLTDDPEELEDWPIFQLDLAGQSMFYYQTLAEGYEAIGDLDKALAAAEMTVDAQDEFWALYESQNDPATPEYQELLDQHSANRESILRTLHAIHRGRNDVANTLASARDVLEVAPDDLQMVMLVPQLMSVEIPEDPEQRTAHLDEAEEYANRAITLFEEWAASDASAAFAAEQKAGLVAQTHSILGVIHFERADFASAADAFGDAARTMPSDASFHYQLGIAYNNSQNREDAASALARAVYLGMDEARPALESLYQAMNNGSLDGLDDFVEAEGEQLSAQ